MDPMLARLETYKQLIDDDIAGFSDRLLKDWNTRYTSRSGDFMNAYTSLLTRGGKRLRGSLTMNAYEMLGGDDRQLCTQAARVIEMVHAYLLILDDIADRSDTRRGGPSTHRLLEKFHTQNNLTGDPAHFGSSMAMHAAIAGMHLAMVELTKLPVNDTTKLEALNSLNESLITTINGQFLDIYNESVRTGITEEQLIQSATWKTAYYSFLNPLEFGAILAGAEQSELAPLKDYSMNMGISFQVTDDILGMFGDQNAIGKSAQDDLKQGKITLLISRALERSDSEQKQTLLNILGNQNLTRDDYQKAKQIIEDTGALDYARKLAENHAAKAVQALNDVPSHWLKEGLDFLKGMAEYVVKRSL